MNTNQITSYNNDKSLAKIAYSGLDRRYKERVSKVNFLEIKNRLDE